MKHSLTTGSLSVTCPGSTGKASSVLTVFIDCHTIFIQQFQKYICNIRIKLLSAAL